MSDEPAGFEQEHDDPAAALLKAARDGQVELVREWLDRGAAIDSSDSDGRTPLTWAASRRRYEVVKLLLDRGASVGDRDRGMIEEWLHWLAARGEAAYDKMYDARNSTAAAACYSDAKSFLQDAMALARRLKRPDLVTRFGARLDHIKSVFRSQFSA